LAIQPGNKVLDMVKDALSEIKGSIKDLSTKVDGNFDSYQSKLEALRDKFDKLRSDHDKDFTRLETESKAYARNWSMLAGIACSVITGLIVYFITHK
jgi:Skp family chaperone for outer membrane proteins